MYYYGSGMVVKRAGDFFFVWRALLHAGRLLICHCTVGFGVPTGSTVKVAGEKAADNRYTVGNETGHRRLVSIPLDYSYGRIP
jgi:hypothetical protein